MTSNAGKLQKVFVVIIIVIKQSSMAKENLAEKDPLKQFIHDNDHLNNDMVLIAVEAIRNMFAKLPLLLGTTLVLLKVMDKNFKMPDEDTLTELKIALSANTFAPPIIKLATRYFGLRNKKALGITHFISFITVLLSTTRIYGIYLRHLRSIDIKTIRRALGIQLTLLFLYGILFSTNARNNFGRRLEYETISDTLSRVERTFNTLCNFVRVKLNVDAKALVGASKSRADSQETFDRIPLPATLPDES